MEISVTSPILSSLSVLKFDTVLTGCQIRAHSILISKYIPGLHITKQKYFLFTGSAKMFLRSQRLKKTRFIEILEQYFVSLQRMQ